MPFGHWTDFNACITDMMGPPNNYSKEVAEKTCGKLQGRLEGKEVFKILKSSTGQRVIEQYVSVEDLDKDSDIIPMHRLKEGLEEIKAWDPRYHSVNWRHTSYKIGHPLWSFTDEDGVVHKTEVDEYGLWGITEIRNDGYKKADEIWNKIVRGEKMGASIGVTPSARPITLTKEVLKERGLNPRWEGAKYWDVPLQFIEPWSLTERPANQYVTAAVVLSKELCDPCIEARAKRYLEKGLEKDEDKARERAVRFFERVAEIEDELETPKTADIIVKNEPAQAKTAPEEASKKETKPSIDEESSLNIGKIEVEAMLRRHGFGK